MAAEDHIVIGEILGVHGTRGELKVKILTDFPERFFADSKALLTDPSGKQPDRKVRFVGARYHRNRLLLTLEGFTTPESSKALFGFLLQIPRSEVRALPEGSYYHFDLVGLNVFTEEGAHLGDLVEVISTDANDVFLVKGEKELLIPALKKNVKLVDLDKRRMVVALEEEY
jgi:16S rRNA processing protein RimM